MRWLWAWNNAAVWGSSSFPLLWLCVSAWAPCQKKVGSPQILSILVFVRSHGGPSYDYGTVGLFFIISPPSMNIQSQYAVLDNAKRGRTEIHMTMS